MFHETEAAGRIYHALGPILADNDGSVRRAVLFSVTDHAADTRICSVVTLVHVAGKEPAETLLVAFTEPTLAIRAWTDRVLQHTFCVECRQGSEPIMCPETFGRCARRDRDGRGPPAELPLIRPRLMSR